jgi:DnaJ-class molecular chaperone
LTIIAFCDIRLKERILRLIENFMKTNPWTTLGIGQKASSKDIRSAYLRLVAIHHPDRGGNSSRFDDIQKAFDTLSDPVKRREFERTSNEKPITKLAETVHEIVNEFWTSVTPNSRKD